MGILSITVTQITLFHLVGIPGTCIMLWFCKINYDGLTPWCFKFRVQKYQLPHVDIILVLVLNPRKLCLL